jgi:succinyl-CoA synthetase alpha subunit
MSILLNKNSHVVVQGITGKEATYHTQQMIDYGTKIVGGVTPGKGGTTHIGLPVFNSVADAGKQEKADVSIIFVPPAFAADAIMESAEAGIKLIVCITEGIPVKDMVIVKEYISNKDCRLIGPNCPGIITPGEAKVGIMPGFIHKQGLIGIVSRSGTLTYEAVDQLTKEGLGQSTAIGIGGDPIVGTSILDAMKLFMEDKDTKGIVLIGEIGGNMETDAAYWIKEIRSQKSEVRSQTSNLRPQTSVINAFKPVVSFIAGATAPKGRTMGHAGAIIGSKNDTAEAKKVILRDCGIHVVDSPADIGSKMTELLNK